MQIHPFAATATASLLFIASGCSSVPEAPRMELSEFNKVAHVGTVFYKTYLPSTPQNSIPMVIPVFVGGALIPLPTSAGFGGRSRAFYLYYIRPTGGGELLRVAYPEQIPDSTCVEVVIHKDQIAKDGYQIGEAVLKPSTLCK